MNPSKQQKVAGEVLSKMKARDREPKPVKPSLHKRVMLGRYDTYEAALTAKNRENRYPFEQLQIRKKSSGQRFDLVARIPVKSTSTTLENENND